MRGARRGVLGLGLVVSCAWGCSGGDAGQPDAAVITQVIPPPVLDLLVVVDNSGAMEGEQNAFIHAFGGITEALETLPWGLPDLHVGVISSNAGAGGQPADGCDGDGDDGVMINAPRIPGCTPPAGSYIAIERGDDGIVRRNDGGRLLETFACIAHLGTNGCGFEQHLESMRRALTEGKNPGFLRPDAHLAVVFLADEDDCSAKDTTMYDPAPMTISDPLGPATSFRCFEHGVTCDGERPPREPRVLDPAGGERACEPAGARADGDEGYLWHPQVYVDFLKGLKIDPGKLVVAGVLGDVEPVQTYLNDNGNPQLSPSCGVNGAELSAAPAIRLGAFLDAFPGRSSFQSICAVEQGPALEAIGALIAGVLARPCLTGDVEPAGCVARYAGGVEVAFELVAAPDVCGETPTGLAIELADARAAEPVIVTCPVREGGSR